MWRRNIVLTPPHGPSSVLSFLWSTWGYDVDSGNDDGVDDDSGDYCDDDGSGRDDDGNDEGDGGDDNDGDDVCNGGDDGDDDNNYDDDGASEHMQSKILESKLITPVYTLQN